MADLARAASTGSGDSSSRIHALSVCEHAAVEVADHALERLLHLVAALAVDEAERDGAARGAVEDDVARLLRQVLPGRVEVETVGAREAGRAPACSKGEGGFDLAHGTTAPS